MAYSEYLLGKRERMTWVAETSFGAGGTMTAGDVVGLNCTLTPSFAWGWQEVMSAGADVRYLEEKVAGAKLLPFTMNFVPVNWKFLKYLMSCVDGGAPSVYTHTFSVPMGLPGSFKLEWARRHTTAHVLTLTGGTLKSATINFSKPTAAEGFVTVDAECVAKKVHP